MKRTTDRIDVLKEIINIGVGRGADVLNTMVGSHVHLKVPCLKILSASEFEQEIRKSYKEQLSSIQLPFKGDFSGVSELVFSSNGALKFLAALTQDQPENTDIDPIRADTLCEVGNIVLNAVLGTISNLFGSKFVYSIPCYTEGDFDSLLPLHSTMPDETVLLARTHFTIENLEVDGNIILFFEIGSFDKLLEVVDAYDKAKRP